MSQAEGLRPPRSPRATADLVTGLVSTASVRGGLSIYVFRHVLRWALARVTPGAAEASIEGSWAARASDARLRSASLRPVAWTAVFEDVEGGEGDVERAAALVVAAMRFRAELASPSCPTRLREHCERLFGTTLVPGPRRFEVHRGAGRHIVVGVSGALRAVDVLDEDGGVRAEADIADDLRACLSAKPVESPPVLAATALPRPEAAVRWQALARDSPEPSRLLLEAQLALFFDPGTPADVDAAGRLAQGGPVGNRSFWHATQLVVFRNGKAAIVGSFVAGLEGEGALEVNPRLGAARPMRGERRTDERAPRRPAPRLLEWTVDASTSAALAAASKTPVGAAGGFLFAPRFGARTWRDAGVSAEAAIVVALRLALDAAVPDLDELECMVNLGHVHHGIVTRLGTTTPEMRALLRAAREGTPGDPGLAPMILAALEAQRAHVRDAKRLESAETSLEYTFFALGRLSSAARAVLTVLVRWLAMLVAWRTPKERRADLHRPVVAVDSSVPRRPGVASFGRYGVLAPRRSLWMHHSLGDDELSFVIQPGAEHVRAADELRRSIPRELDRVLAAARARPEPRAPVPEEGSIESVPAASRLAYRRLLGLQAALRDRPSTEG